VSGADKKVSGGEGTIDGEPPALIPPGTYQLRLEHWATRMLFGRQPKVVLLLSICDFGPLFGTKLERWYNASRLNGPPKACGKFAAGWSSDLVREYASIIGMPPRRDRLSLCKYRDLMLTGHVATVTADRKQRRLPPPLQYSIVRQLGRGTP
jgi:hypothetical protein